MVEEPDAGLDVNDLDVKSRRVVEAEGADNLGLVGVAGNGRDALRKAAGAWQNGSEDGGGGSGHGEK